MRPTHDVAPGDLARVSIAPRNLRSSVPGGELLSKVATISTGASHRLIARKRRSSFGSSTNRRWILRNETPDAPLSRSRLEVRSVVRTRALSSVPRGKAVLRTVPGAATRRAQQRRTRQVVPFQELVYGRRESDGPSAPWRWLLTPARRHCKVRRDYLNPAGSCQSGVPPERSGQSYYGEPCSLNAGLPARR